MNKKYLNIVNRIIALVIVGIILFSSAPILHAANLTLVPSAGNYSEGKAFSVSVNVVSTDQAMNAVQGKLFFSKDTLEVVGISKNNSIISLWVQEPSFSNATGAITFEGVVFNPGYKGPDGRLLTITFKAKNTGDSIVNFSESSVYANNGEGTNILKNSINGRYIISDAKKIEPVQTPTVVVPTVEVEPEPQPSEEINVQAPEFVYDDVPVKVITEESFLKIGSFEANFFTFVLILLVLFLSIILSVLYGLIQRDRFKRKMQSSLKHIHHLLHTSFNLLKSDMRENIHVLERVKSKRALTEEEGMLTDNLNRNFDDVEEIITKKINELEKLVKGEKD